MDLRTSPQAELDLDTAWLYLARESGSEEIASRAIESITDTYRLLAKFPQLGRCRDIDLRVGVRSFAVDNYVILYRVRSAEVQILRVLHGSRDARAIIAEQ